MIMLKAILAVALLGQLEMNVELGENALDLMPELVDTKKAKAEPTSEERQRIEEIKARRAAYKAAKYQRFREVRAAKGYARAQARRYRLANPQLYPSRYAQRLQTAYASQVYQHGVAMGYIWPNDPRCSASRASVLGH